MDASPLPQGPAGLALKGWDQVEPRVLRFLRRVSLKVGLVAAAPFLALALLFALLAKPLSWVLVPAVVGALLVGLALVAYLLLRRQLRRLRAKVEAVREREALAFAALGR